MNFLRLDHFSLLAPHYDRLLGLSDLERLEALLALPPGGLLLDAGGGTGRVAQALGGRAVVADSSAAMLAQAGQKTGLAPTQAQIERLPFPAAHFERILVVDAFHHFYDQFLAAAEFWRLLAPGGRLVLEEPNIDTWPIKLVALAERLALMRSRFFSARDLRSLFQALGGRVSIEAGHAYKVWVVVEKE